MEKKFEKIWNYLVEECGHEEGDIVAYEEVLEASNSFNYLMSMQEVSDFEKTYNIDIEW